MQVKVEPVLELLFIFLIRLKEFYFIDSNVSRVSLI